VVVTSVSLTPAAKEQVLAAMAPFILSTADILGADDINGLLSRHPGIERRNFKLWLTNTEVIARILHSAEICRTDFEVGQIRKKLPIFVQSDAFPRAREILDERRVLVVSGPPGIGKTTLAEMLLFAHLEEGFEPVVIQCDISEGRRLFSPDRRQIFYYDDFLGQTFLGDQRQYVAGNHDAALISFVQMVSQASNSRFILTTREHILRQAKQISERLHHNLPDAHSCVLQMSDYSFGQRARILYNHLYFSDLPRSLREAVLADEFYLRILRHPNFSPRLVEWLCSIRRLNLRDDSDYCGCVMRLLNKPAEIWSHAFNTQISDAARDLLFVIYSVGYRVDISELEPAFEAAHAAFCTASGRASAFGAFRSALKELEGGFIRFSSDGVDFLNPSVRDFVGDTICDTPPAARVIVRSAFRFKQIAAMWRLARQPQGGALLAMFVRESDSFCAAVERVLYGPAMRSMPALNGRGGFFSYIDSDEDTRFSLICEWAESFNSGLFVELAARYAESLSKHWLNYGVDFNGVVPILGAVQKLTWFRGHGGEGLLRTLVQEMVSHTEFARASEWQYLLDFSAETDILTPGEREGIERSFAMYVKKGAAQEADECRDLGTLEEFYETLGELNSKYKLGLRDLIESVEERIGDMSRYEGDERWVTGKPSAAEGSAPTDTVTEDDVREMFRGLLH